jgi:ankyrin repeat protein
MLYLCNDVKREIIHYLTLEEIVKANLFDLFVLYPDFNVFNWYYSAKYGRLNMIKWLYENGKKGCIFSILECAAEYGHIDIIKYLQKFTNEHFTLKALYFAAKNGHFEIVKQLDKYNKIGKPSSSESYCYKLLNNQLPIASDIAAENGYYNIVKFLNKKKYAFSKCAMTGAIKNGHYRIVRFLYKNRTEGCFDNSIDLAAENGHLKIIKFITKCEKKKGTIFSNQLATSNAIDMAANNGYFDVVKWLFENRTERCREDAINFAAQKGHFNIVKYLWEKTEWCYSERTLDIVIKHNYMDIAKWIYKNAKKNGEIYAIEVFLEVCHPNILKIFQS